MPIRMDCHCRSLNWHTHLNIDGVYFIWRDAGKAQVYSRHLINPELRIAVMGIISSKITSAVSLLHNKIISKRQSRKLEQKYISTFFDSKYEYDKYIDELSKGTTREFLEEMSDRAIDSKSFPEHIETVYPRELYALLRKYQPETIIETGVRSGISTTYQLAALQMNGSGHLYSIDYPVTLAESDEEFIEETSYTTENLPTNPNGKEPGYAVPPDLREDWDLILGKSQRKLPSLLEDIEEVDFFYHDSDHSAHCMMFEFEVVWEYLASSGIIVADDIGWNDAYDIFVDELSPIHAELPSDVGIMKKQ